ncbi:MAG TPA: hemerythrin domain-containing protein [Candidatus Angelobacter sp.]|jgi:hemerythrin-like domain-containing protein|nr:hemerythrin domain-containing protein [Candidatus Angelobacter sp.]
MKTSRRDFLIGTSALAGSTLVVPLSALAAQKTLKKAAKKTQEAEDDVSTNEDLMREHGVLNRVLLIYDEANRRIQANEKFDPAVVTKSAGIIKSFIEDYHEKLEEDHIFPRFEQAGKLIELTVNLRAQHAMGRRVTERIVATAKSGENESLRTLLAAFNRMYRPHEAREDTVLFPALHKVVSKHEYDAMGEEFERIERKTFGGDGFEMAVDQVTELEKQFGIYDIAQFTPTLPPAK